MNTADTIVAVATPPGRGGIGVIRVSGSRAAEIATRCFGKLPEPRRATLAIARTEENTHIDQGLLLYFRGPHSFTGEDVVEFHGHGGPVVMDLLVSRILQLGARSAEPGEFSQRAFLNNKLDLAQAEAIADLIDSGSQQAARAAMRSLQGEFSTRAHAITRQLIDARTYVEAAIDFPDEEIDFLADTELRQRLDRLLAEVNDTLGNAQQGALLRDGMTVVIAGRPNAGKSSLLNALAGYEAAIVTPIAGTTRDVLRERIAIDGMPLHILDTAGLRDTDDIVEREGIKRARDEMQRADRILYLIDCANEPSETDLAKDLSALPHGVPTTLVYNKIDIKQPQLDLSRRDCIGISARTGEGVPALRNHLRQSMGLQESSATTFSARRRHLDALSRAQQRIVNALDLLAARKAGELMAEELRLAQQDIGEITGEFTSDDLLGKIFSSFCIGK